MIDNNSLNFIKEQRTNYLKHIREQKLPLVIYGAGKYGQLLGKLLTDEGINFHCFCVTKEKYNLRELNGFAVRSLEDLIADEKDYCFLIGVRQPTNKNIINELNKNNISNYIDVPEYMELILESQDKPPVLDVTTKIGCSINCHFCPQASFMKKYYKNTDVNEMSFETFKKCIDKTPKNLVIYFAGFVEPFLAKDAVKMIKYAAFTGRKIHLYTTLVGLNLDSLKEIESIPFELVVLHLPDVSKLANIPMTKEYFELLRYIMSIKKSNGELFVSRAHSHSEPHPDVMKIVGDKILITYELFDRAGNLQQKDDDRVNLQTKSTNMNKNAKRYCSRSFDLNQNILLPNGDVLLCCMDWGMQHVLGNLLEQSYEDIRNGNELNYVKSSLQNGNKHVLCSNCHAIRTII